MFTPVKVTTLTATPGLLTVLWAKSAENFVCSDKYLVCNIRHFKNKNLMTYVTYSVAVFSLVFRVTGKSVFWTGKAALLKIFFYPGVELSS